MRSPEQGECIKVSLSVESGVPGPKHVRPRIPEYVTTFSSEPERDAGCQKLTIQYKNKDKWMIMRSSIAKNAGKRCSNEWIKESDIFPLGGSSALVKCKQSVCYGNLCNGSLHMISNSYTILISSLFLWTFMFQ